MSRVKSFWKEWRLVFYIGLFMLVFRSAIANWYIVPTGSMKPTLVEGDYVLANILAYQLKLPFSNRVIARWDNPERGDIVVFESPNDNKRLVKRVIGLPGDVIALRDNRLYINGEMLKYELGEQADAVYYWDKNRIPLLVEEKLGDVAHPIAVEMESYGRFQNFGPVVVPDEHYFMLGDNRDNSADSRAFGMVHQDLIHGKAQVVLLSLDIKQDYLPRADRSLLPLYE